MPGLRLGGLDAVRIVAKAILWLLGLIGTSVLVLNVERIAQAHRLDDLVPDPATVPAFSAFLHHPLTVVMGAIGLGLFVGLSADTLIRKVFRSEAPTRRDKMILLGLKMQNLSEELSRALIGQDLQSAIARLNILMTEASRLGLPLPHAKSDGAVIRGYLTHVGTWLAEGDLAGAKLQAGRMSPQRDSAIDQD